MNLQDIYTEDLYSTADVLEIVKYSEMIRKSIRVDITVRIQDRSGTTIFAAYRTADRNDVDETRDFLIHLAYDFLAEMDLEMTKEGFVKSSVAESYLGRIA